MIHYMQCNAPICIEYLAIRIIRIFMVVCYRFFWIYICIIVVVVVVVVVIVGCFI